MPLNKIKVLIVEDSPLTQQILAPIFRSDPQIEVIGTARNGAEALKLLLVNKPDVVTVDINTPQMDSFELTRWIMESHPVPVVIVSASLKPRQVATTFRAVEAGAVAVVEEPHAYGHPDHDNDAKKLLQTVKAMSELKVVRRWSRLRRNDAASISLPEPSPLPPSTDIRLVAIGASTGGPSAIQTILSLLPGDFPAPILIVQHIAAGFLGGFAEWLENDTHFPVQIAGQGQSLLPGHAYLAPDGSQMGVGSDLQIALTTPKKESGPMPSISHLFASVARAFGAHAAGVLLTGMGRDGADELMTMKRTGALTVVQDQESCVVFGMPAEAIKIGAAGYVLSPEKIAPLLVAAASRK